MSIAWMALDALPRWEWSASLDETFRSTPMWPELIGTLGLAALALVMALHARGAGGAAPRRGPPVLVVLALLGFLVTVGGVGSALAMLVEHHFERGLWPFSLVVASTAAVGGVATAVGLARARSARFGVALAGAGLLVGAPIAHALVVAFVPWPSITVTEGSPHQHVGLAQEIIANVPAERGWGMTRSHARIDGATVGDHAIELVAEGYGQRIRRVFRVRVGEERGVAWFPLAQGNCWAWRLTALDGAWEPFEEELCVTERRTEGPLHLVLARVGSREQELYAIDGVLYARRDGRSEPLFAEPPEEPERGARAPALVPARPSAGPFRVAVLGLDCAELASSGGALALPGPTRCSGTRTEGLSGGQVVAAIFTLGFALPFMHTPSHPVQATLVRSTRVEAPAFEIPSS